MSDLVPGEHRAALKQKLAEVFATKNRADGCSCKRTRLLPRADALAGRGRRGRASRPRKMFFTLDSPWGPIKNECRHSRRRTTARYRRRVRRTHRRCIPRRRPRRRRIAKLRAMAPFADRSAASTDPDRLDDDRLSGRSPLPGSLRWRATSTACSRRRSCVAAVDVRGGPVHDEELRAVHYCGPSVRHTEAGRDRGGPHLVGDRVARLAGAVC